MATEPIDYVAVLEDLRARRTGLDRAIAAIEQIVAQLGTVASQPKEASLGDDAFFSMSVPDAIRKYLSIVRKKKTAKEITDGLEAGGLEHVSKNFYNTVYTMLSREWSKADPEIVKIGDQWGLAEWYPGRKIKKKADAENGAAAEPSDEEASGEGAKPE
jgi:hypothetical protein